MYGFNITKRSYGPVLRHIGVVHRFGPSCSIRCGIDGCPATHKSEEYESFRYHVYQNYCAVLCASQDGREMMGEPDCDINPVRTENGQSVVDDASTDNYSPA